MALSETGRYRMVRYGIFILAALAHLVLLHYLRITIRSDVQPPEAVAEVIKLVDFQEYIPPPPPPVLPERRVVKVIEQPSSSEDIIEVDEEILPAEEAPSPPVQPEYLPQHKISKIPDIPVNEILDRIEYPPMALRQNLEAVVYVELYIDQTGLVRRIVVLKDPGNGFAEAAVKALEGLQCRPAEANGKPVAVRFRYPIRFVLN